VVGTIGYMSPEQVRGQQIDHRSDIFSFGAVLYEMMSGSRAFDGATPADTLSAILNLEPGELPPLPSGRGPSGLERIARHCLEKEPGRRYQSTRDLAFDVEAFSQGSGIEPSVVVDSPAPARQILIAVACAGLIIGAVASWLVGRLVRPNVADRPTIQQVGRITQES